MAVTELALLHTKNNQPLSPETKSTLVSGATAQATFSSYPVRLYTQTNDESYIYLIGGWESVAQHMNEWIPSSTNQNIMASLGNELEVVWMFHVDMEPYTEEDRDCGSPLHGNILVIERLSVPETKTGDFDEGFAKVRGSIGDGGLSRWELRAGWRVDYRDEQLENRIKEFILLTGWESSADYDGLVEEEKFGFAESLVQETEVRYAWPMRLE